LNLPPCTFVTQEEITSGSEAIGLGGRVEEERKEVTCEDEVNYTSPVRASVVRSSTPNSHIGG
jgi:hypothetical protein